MFLKIDSNYDTVCFILNLQKELHIIVVILKGSLNWIDNVDSHK